MLDVVEAYFAANVLEGLHKTGVLDRLHRAHSAAELGKHVHFDPSVLNSLLMYLATTTDIVTRARGDRFQLPPRYRRYEELGFHIDKLIRGFGAAVCAMSSGVHPTRSTYRVDDRALATAFSQIQRGLPSPLGQVISSLEVTSMIDLGCGTGDLVIEAAKQNPGMKALGIDVNTHMCLVAKERVRQEGLGGRVRIQHGDVRQIGHYLSSRAISRVQMLTAGSLLNSFSLGQGDEISQLLQMLSKLFPGRTLLVDDYFGMLGTRQSIKHYRHAFVHDLVQLASNQGIPPSNSRKWRRLYNRANCRLIRHYEGGSSGFRWFVDVVKLAAECGRERRLAKVGKASRRQ